MLIFGSAGSRYKFDLQGHRGARGLAPENTLAGFEAALCSGVSTLELDICMTSDGQVVVVHNPHLEPELTRDRNGKWLTKTGPAINSLTFNQLKAFDVGRLNPKLEYSKRFPKQISMDGATIPALYEVFELVKNLGADEIQFNIEMKSSPLQPDLSPCPKDFVLSVTEIIKTYKLESNAVIQSFDWQLLQIAQKISPEIPTSYLTAQQSWFDTIHEGTTEISPWLAGFNIDDYSGSIVETIKAAGGKIWAPFFKEVDLSKVKLAHTKNLLVKVWTVNEFQDMLSLIDMGVDGIITDYPNVLREALKKRKMNLQNYYWYYQKAVPEHICDKIVKYGLQIKEQMAITGGYGDPKKMSAKAIKDLKKKNL